MQSEPKFEENLLENSENKMKIKYINNNTQVNKIINKILLDKGCIVGVDLECAVEMSRFGILCLLQVKNVHF